MIVQNPWPHSSSLCGVNTGARSPYFFEITPQILSFHEQSQCACDEKLFAVIEGGSRSRRFTGLTRASSFISGSRANNFDRTGSDKARKDRDATVAFLRGINIIGHKTLKMDSLRRAFETMGHQNVRTHLASGNVVFETQKMSPKKLVKTIGERLEQALGYEITAILRSLSDLEDLVDSKPFKNVAVTPRTKLWVTFLAEKPMSSLKIPFTSPRKDFRIVRVSATEVCSVLNLSRRRGGTHLMSFLDKEFGRNITTRNWNTIVRILRG